VSRNKISRASFVLCTVLLASGCGGSGGGGSNDDNTPPEDNANAQGLWVGTTADHRDVTGLIFENGLYYVLYSAPYQPGVIAGVVQGNGSTRGDTFTSTNGRDFNLEGDSVLDARIEATVVERQTFSGGISNNVGGSNNFSAAYSNDYEITPTIASVAGTYTGEVASSAGYEDAVITVSSNGTLSGVGDSGCTVSGNVAPRGHGNAYVIELRFGGAPCLFANQTLTGIGYFDARTDILYAAAPSSDRRDGVLFFGLKE